MSILAVSINFSDVTTFLGVTDLFVIYVFVIRHKFIYFSCTFCFSDGSSSPRTLIVTLETSLFSEDDWGTGSVQISSLIVRKS